MSDDRPAWARRMLNERQARGWSQADAIKAMRAHAPIDPRTRTQVELPSTSSLIRQYKRWGAGEVEPDKGKAQPFYKPIIAAMFGTVTHAMFPVASKRDADGDVLAVTGMDTLELVSRLQRSDLDQATLDGLRIMADRLCSEYPYMPSEQLLIEGRAWLRRVVSFRGQRLTLGQHREILTLAGWIALLIACVEYDSGDRQAAETTRQAALSLGTEAENAEVKAWAHEIRAWIALTTGNYHGVVSAAHAGIEVAPHHSVAIQLAAQEAKAWARIGDRRATEVALDKGRRLLEVMPYPDNLDHHFVVDPTKYDFYMMDCYRHLTEDRLAETLANEVIRASTDFDGTERAPMRQAEAQITLGVIAARRGDLEEAIDRGVRALSAPRKSLPSLLMVSRDLTRVLNDRYPSEPETHAYLDQIHALSVLTGTGSHRPANSGSA